MTLQVKLFAKAKQIVGLPIVTFDWTDGQTVLDLKDSLARQYPDLVPLIPQLLVAINNTYAMDNASIKITDEVACFPPVSGG